jgi:glycosyltransferase involved in cell wall biosynthesis
MKILYITRYFYPRLGGGEQVLWQILNGLAKKGHKVYVITSKLDNTLEHEEINGIEIFRPFLGTSSMINGLGFSIKLFSYLKYFLKSNPVDIMFSGAYGATIPTSHVAHNNHIPSITYVTYYYGKTWFLLVNPFAALFNYLVPFFTLYLGNCDIICCPSKIVSQNLKHYSNSRLVVIPSPIDMDEIKRVIENTAINDIRTKLGVQNNQRFLVFVGRLSPEKNISQLIKILNTININFKLIIVGDGPERSKIENLIDKLGMDNKISLVGRKNHEDTLTIMKASDSIILASKKEVYPTVVLEALALGKPVISTRVGGVSEMNSPNLYLVNKLEEINELLLKHINEKPDPSFIKSYSLEIIVSEFENMFKDAINNHKLNKRRVN